MASSSSDLPVLVLVAPVLLLVLVLVVLPVPPYECSYGKSTLRGAQVVLPALVLTLVVLWHEEGPSTSSTSTSTNTSSTAVLGLLAGGLLTRLAARDFQGSFGAL